MKAWEMIYENQHDAATLDMVRSLFPNAGNSMLEERLFTQVHMAVLGLTRESLEKVILENRDQINKVDLFGRTALSWAVRRGDSIAIVCLLEAGADPNIEDTCHDDCLTLAAETGNLAITKLLLGIGAPASFQNCSDSTALGCAVWRAKSPEIIDILVAAGADIEHRGTYGCTPLHSAACFGNAVAVRTFLKYQPSVDVQDSDGDTPLLDAAITGHNESIGLLLQHGADYQITNHKCNTLLHYAAIGGNLETLSILRAAKLTKIDPSLKNSDGKTAFQIAQQRYSKPEGFIDLLMVLLQEIRCRNDYVSGPPQSNHDTTGPGPVGTHEEDDDEEDVRFKMPGAWPCG